MPAGIVAGVPGGIGLLDAVQVSANGTALWGVRSGTVSLNPGSINATTRGTVTFALTGAATGDTVIMVPPDTLEDDLLFVGARVTSASTVTVYLYNPTGGAIDGAALTWGYTWLDFTE
jgi:hypothetical protein